MSDYRAHHIYHAHALGVAGNIIRPIPQMISSLASTSLSPMGGHGSDHVENFELKGIVSFRSAFVEVAGTHDKETDTHSTISSAVIEKLEIMGGIVTADRVVARLSSHHPMSAKQVKDQPGKQKPADKSLGEPSITPTGSYFENLRVAGYPIALSLKTHLFCEHDTFSKVEDEHKGKLRDSLLCNKLKGAKGKHPSLDRFYHGLEDSPQTHGIYICSMANHLDLKANPLYEHELENFGSVIYVPKFGVIHLAELVIERYSRRLNMVRIHMGSPIEGTISAAALFSNGTTIPPTGGGGG
jgi:hypothetical protein